MLYIEAPVGFGGSLTGLLQLIAELPAHVEPVLVTSLDPAPFIDLPAGLTHRQADVPTWKAAGGHWIPGVARYLRQHVGPWT
ncbi:MAG TPA: hypothetical protein PKC18_20030, partial [Lacipirellulaceae bacterium]|nr:hypothetical protein [Lacipirellulaceae bacterium]